MHRLSYEPRTSVRTPAAPARQNTRTIFWHMSPLCTKELALGLSRRQSGKKVFLREEIYQLVLARSDREAAANTAIEFAAKLGFVARQRRNDLWKRAEAGESAGAKGHSRQ